MGMNVALGFFMMFAGVYMLISGIRGKGAVYVNESVKEAHKAKYKRFVRISCCVISPVFIANFVLATAAYLVNSKDYSAYSTEAYNKAAELYNALALATQITLWAALVLAVGMVVISILIANKE